MPPKKAPRWSIKDGFLATLPKDISRLSPALLTPFQLLSAYGLAPPSISTLSQVPACPNRWTGTESSSVQNRIIETITLESDDGLDFTPSPSPLKSKKPASKGKGKTKEISTCSAEKCANNPNCLNWLGQAKWENSGEPFGSSWSIFRSLTTTEIQTKHSAISAKQLEWECILATNEMLIYPSVSRYAESLYDKNCNRIFYLDFRNRTSGRRATSTACYRYIVECCRAKD